MLVATIVANNPGDPEAASMEVSETKLVNFAEKTKFDVTSEYQYALLEKQGNADQLFVDYGIAVIYPDVATLLAPDGSWDRSADSTIRFSAGGVIYESVDDIPVTEPAHSVDLKKAYGKYLKETWKPFLEGLGTKKEETVFQLEPNQLLTVTSGFKVVLRRPVKS